MNRLNRGEACDICVHFHRWLTAVMDQIVEKEPDNLNVNVHIFQPIITKRIIGATMYI